MKVTATVEECKDILRDFKESFEKNTKGSDAKYKVAFAFSPAQEMKACNTSFIKSYIEAFAKAVSSFPGTDFVNIAFVFNEEDTLENKITQEVYEAHQVREQLKNPKAKGPSDLAAARPKRP